MRRLNLIFLARFLTVLAVSGGGVYLLHWFQVRRCAASLLHQAQDAEKARDLAKTARILARYLSVRQHDGPVLAWYARIVDAVTPPHGRRDQVLDHYEEALLFNPGDRGLERRCAEIALEPGVRRYQVSLRHIGALLEPVVGGSGQAVEVAELDDLRGQCLEASSEFEQAANSFRQSIQKDPARVETRDRLARLLRLKLEQPGQADLEIDEMVEKNPASALAHVIRYRYRRAVGESADDEDIARALELGPDEAETLIAAAELARERNDLVAARKHIERGLQLHSDKPAFYAKQAEIELAENRPDLAETILRRGIDAVPSSNDLKVFQSLLDLKLKLSEVLLDQGRLDGEEGAKAWIQRLRQLGLLPGLDQYLEARASMAEEAWDRAITQLESARTLLAGNTAALTRVNILLSQCHARRGEDDKRIAAFHRIAADSEGAILARPMLAQALEDQGRFEEALRIHEELQEARPKSRLDLIRLLILTTRDRPPGLRDWTAVEQKLAEVEQALPQSSTELTLLQANLLAAKGQAEDARRLLENAIRREPRLVSYRIALAHVFLGRGGNASADAQRAIEILDQAEYDLGRTLEVTTARVEALARLGTNRARGALHEIAESVATWPAADQPVLFEALAKASLALGEPDRSVQLLRQLASRLPGNISAQIRMVELATAGGDLPQAALGVKQIRRIEGESGVNWRYANGLHQLALARSGDQQALEQVRLRISELEQHPQWWGASALRAQLAELQGSPDEAARNYLRAVELGTDRMLLVRRVMALLDRLQRFEEMDRVARQLMERGRPFGELALIRAMSALRRNRTDEALAIVRQFVEGGAGSPDDFLFAGQLLLGYGKPEEAEKPLRKATEMAPGSADAWLAYLRFLVHANRKQEAAALLSKLGDVLPAERALLAQAQAQELLGDRAKADVAYSKAIDRRPTDSLVLRHAAEFFAQFDPKRALSLVDRLLDPASKINSTDRDWARQTRVILLGATGDVKLDDVDSALAAVESQLRADPTDFGEQRMRALLLSLRYGRRKQAALALRQLDGQGALGPGERFMLAWLYAAERDWAGAKEEMQRVLQLAPREPHHLFFYVTVLVQLKEFGEAKQRLDELKALIPATQSATTFVMEANLLAAQGRDKELAVLARDHAKQHPQAILAVAAILDRHGLAREAETYYRAQAASEPERAEKSLPLIDFLARKDRCHEAVALAEAAEGHCRPEALAMATLGIFEAPSATDHQKSRAEAWLTRAIQASPENLVLLGKLASVRGRQQKYDQAEALYRRILAANKDHLEALNNLAWHLALRGQNPNEALELAERARDLAGPNPAVLDTYAAALMRQGLFDKALESLREAIAVGPPGPMRYFHLALAQQGAHNTEEARKAIEQADRLGLTETSIDPRERESYRKLRMDLGL
jgi:tetratricopeptide (TPR) repeat protein